MKRQAATDSKRSAANDKPENGKAEKTKVTTSLRTVPPEPERYAIGSSETVKRLFLKESCDFTRKKGTVDAAMLIAEFAGRQIDGHRIDAARVHRYIRYAVNNGQFKKAK
jgi:hypothetical protein